MPITFMAKRKIFLIISFIFLILTSFRIGWIMYYQTPDHPHAVNGIVDLHGWEFNDKQSISLNGEWEFYPNKFIPPNTIDPSAQHEVVTIPGDMLVQFGTYRLRILLPPDDRQTYGLRIQDISASSHIYVNGSLITEVGQPGTDKQQYSSKLGTYKATFPANHSELEMIIHVANYEIGQAGGITRPIKFGTEAAINKETHLTKTIQLLVAIILIVHSLYAFGLYFIGKNKSQKELVYFGLLLIFASFSILVDDDKLLVGFLPINASLSLKLLYLSFAGTVYFILKFIKHVFQLQSTMFRLLFISYIISTLFLFILPTQLISYVGYGIMLLNAVSYTFIFVQVLKVIQSGNADAFYILIANVINLFNVLWGIAINMNMIDIPYYPFDYLLAIMAFAGFLFKRHISMVQLNREQTKKLQREDKIKDDFLANTSHELRNPLHGIINIAQSIISDHSEPLTKKNKDNLQLLIHIGQRMTYTLNDILDNTRLKEQKLRLQKERINLHTVTTGVMDMIRFMTEGKNLQLYLKIPPTFPDVFADENRLIQILFNLIQNAVKFTDMGTVTVHATHMNGIAAISIKDTGIGMDEKTLRKVFHPYEQANASMTSMGSGIGLGLTICKQLVELHNGEIFAESVLGQGSIFTFTIPLANQPADTNHSLSIAATLDRIDDASQAQVSEQTPLSNRKLPKILVVDDDPVNLKVLCNLLADEYQISTASSGQDALTQINTGEWDLVISDVMMPNMSGYELTQVIRKRFTIAELPILLLTARNQPQDIYTGFMAGANDYVSKPMDILELQARVQALTNLKQSIKKQLFMEAAWLQAQIQPHFLFNTLNTIASLGNIDTMRMVKLLDEFGNYLRRSFEYNNIQSLIPIENELDLTKSYLYIEKERFGDRLKVEWQLGSELTLQVPPLSIQPIVENAVRHGVLKRVHGGTVSIRIADLGAYYEIAITDNGVGMSKEKINQLLYEDQSDAIGIGISNTNRRLRQLFGKGLIIESDLNIGTTVKFQISKQ